MPEFRALVLREEGGEVVPRIEAVDESLLPPGEVIVRIECSTLNYKDGMILRGLGRLVRTYPHIPGIDFAGTVEPSESPEFEPAIRLSSPAGGSAKRNGAAMPRRRGSGRPIWCAGRTSSAPARRWRSVLPD